MSLRSINFNLVPILRALQRHRSVSRAALELGLTQSAVSAALGRLRIALSDPLLVRVGSGMQLTERALELIEPVEQLCRDMDSLLRHPSFDPANLVRDFKIATADWVALNVVTALTPALKEQAPHVNLHFVDGVVGRPHLLVSGDVDLLILPRAALPQVASSSLIVAPLFEDDYVMVVPLGHPLASVERPTEADTAPFRHLVFQFGLNVWDEALQHAVAGNPLRGRISVRLQQLSLMPLLAVETGDVAITPRTVAKRMARWLPLKILPLPGASVILEMCMTWGPLRDADPAHRWLRQLLTQCLRGDSEASGFEPDRLS